MKPTTKRPLFGATACAILMLAALYLTACSSPGSSPGAEPTAASNQEPPPITATAQPVLQPTKPPVEPAATANATDELPVPIALLADALKNTTFVGVLDTPVTLNGGLFEGEPFGEGAASRPIVSLVPDRVDYGDLNGDGQPDAVVFLVSNSGGSGTFTYLAIVAADGEKPVNLATTLLGDRVQVQSVELDDDQITVQMLTQGPDDPMCCPTQQVTKVFRLEGDQLVDASN